jgi:hypothetical protein
MPEIHRLKKYQTSAHPTRSNHNSRLNQLKEGASKQRLTTISTKQIKAQRLTIKSVQSLKIEAQDKKYKDIQKSMMISKEEVQGRVHSCIHEEDNHRDS